MTSSVISKYEFTRNCYFSHATQRQHTPAQGRHFGSTASPLDAVPVFGHVHPANPASHDFPFGSMERSEVGGSGCRQVETQTLMFSVDLLSVLCIFLFFRCGNCPGTS